METLKRRKKNEDDVDGPWSTLHPDLLMLVFSHLSFVDQPAFLCVCKSWRSAVLAAGKQHIKQLWSMEAVVSSPEWVKRTFKFVNYSSRDKCSYIRNIPCLSFYTILTAKHGWVLVGRPASYGNLLMTMFYDPFSHTAIKLPTLNSSRWPVNFFELDERRDLFRFDFSAPPTSPECMVVATFTGEMIKWVFTATCSRGQAAWVRADHRGLDCVWLPHRRMVFHDRSFYCISGMKESHVVGKVLAFHPETNTVRSFSGGPGQAEAAKHPSAQNDAIWCHRLEPAAAIDIVERLGGEELFRELRRRDHPVMVSKWLKQEGLAMLSLGEFPFPSVYQPFLWEEGGQLLVPWNRCDKWVGKRAWLSPRWVQPGQRDLQWVSSNSEVTHTN